jgi:hypothetical protein
MNLLKVGYYKILKFKDCIHLNRAQTEALINKTIFLFGGLMLKDSYKHKSADTESSRSFWFLHGADFDREGLVEAYNDSYKKLTLLDVDFFFDQELELRKEIESIQIVKQTNFNSAVTYGDYLPLTLSKDTGSISNFSIQEDNYILIKPTGFNLLRLSSILACLSKYEIKVGAIKSRRLLNEEFNALYPNCLARVYGADWHSHIFSGECMIIKTVKGSFEQIRSAAWVIRKESGLPWVKNVIHSAASEQERELMLSLFANDFPSRIEPTPNFNFMIF